MSDNVRQLREPADHDLPGAPMFYDRAEAAQIARDLLVVKGGKYAERPVEPEAVVYLAEWLLWGDAFWEDVEPDLKIEVTNRMDVEEARLAGQAIREQLDRVARGQRHPWKSDGLCACPDCKAVDQ